MDLVIGVNDDDGGDANGERVEWKMWDGDVEVVVVVVVVVVGVVVD